MSIKIFLSSNIKEKVPLVNLFREKKKKRGRKIN